MMHIIDISCKNKETKCNSKLNSINICKITYHIYKSNGKKISAFKVYIKQMHWWVTVKFVNGQGQYWSISVAPDAHDGKCQQH